MYIFHLTAVRYVFRILHVRSKTTHYMFAYQLKVFILHSFIFMRKKSSTLVFFLQHDARVTSCIHDRLQNGIIVLEKIAWYLSEIMNVISQKLILKYVQWKHIECFMHYLLSFSGGRNDEVKCLMSSHPGYTLYHNQIKVYCLSYFTLVLKITSAIKFTNSIIII